MLNIYITHHVVYHLYKSSNTCLYVFSHSHKKKVGGKTKTKEPFGMWTLFSGPNAVNGVLWSAFHF